MEKVHSTRPSSPLLPVPFPCSLRYVCSVDRQRVQRHGGRFVTYYLLHPSTCDPRPARRLNADAPCPFTLMLGGNGSGGGGGAERPSGTEAWVGPQSARMPKLSSPVCHKGYDRSLLRAALVHTPKEAEVRNGGVGNPIDQLVFCLTEKGGWGGARRVAQGPPPHGEGHGGCTARRRAP